MCGRSSSTCSPTTPPAGGTPTPCSGRSSAWLPSTPRSRRPASRSSTSKRSTTGRRAPSSPTASDRCAPGRTPIRVTCRSRSRSRPRTAPSPTPGLGFVTPLPWGQATFAELEAEIRSVFPADRVLAPADVRGRSASLRDAVLDGRWPRLDAGAGRSCSCSTTRAPSVTPTGPRCPTSPTARSSSTSPEATPTRRSPSSTTRSATPTASAPSWRPGSSSAPGPTPTRCRPVPATPASATRRSASGAQYVSTDYVWPDDRFGTGYVVDLPGRRGRPLQPGLRPASVRARRPHGLTRGEPVRQGRIS